LPRLKKLVEIASFDSRVFEDLIKQSRPQGFPCVNGDDRCPTVWMLDEVMRAFSSNENETGTLESLERLSTGNAPQPAHTSTATR
jgi:hypothetical protein